MSADNNNNKQVKEKKNCCHSWPVVYRHIPEFPLGMETLALGPTGGWYSPPLSPFTPPFLTLVGWSSTKWEVWGHSFCGILSGDGHFSD